MKKRPPSVQGELLDRRADTTFTHLFSAMFSSGDVREMGETAFMVFCCIKAHSDIGTGLSYPSKDRIADLCGKSHDTVERAVKKLIAMERVEICGKRGRNNVYRCRERFQIVNREGEPVENVHAGYIPRTVAEVQRQVKEYVEKGRVGDGQVIHIEKIEVNINYGTQIETQIIADNVQMNGAYDAEALKERMRAARVAEFEKIAKIIPGVKLKGGEGE